MSIPPMNFNPQSGGGRGVSSGNRIDRSIPIFAFSRFGSPQQEIIAQKLKERGKVRGLALCVGAAIDFLTGKREKAPCGCRKQGSNGLYRLSQNPRRMWKRYMLRALDFFSCVAI